MNYVNTVLIVDDDPSARDTLEALLWREGYNLAFASCGQEAIEKAQDLMPSVILLDVMMPEMDGFEVCQHLRSIPILAEVPIIMVTALDDRNSRLQGIQAGADDFISKPFDREELRARVRAIVRLNRYRRLHQERAKFEWVVQHADDGYLIINEHDEILYANPHACRFLSVPSKQLEDSSSTSEVLEAKKFLELARKQYFLKPQDAWDSWPDLPPQALSSIRYLVRPESLTSEAFWLQVELLDFSSESNTGKVVRLSDVTSQVEAQRNKWGFHTMICHKLRTPLVGILGSLDFLVHQTSQLSPHEIHEFAQMALSSARRLHSEIEDVLQYLTASGRVRSGAGCQVVDFHSIIKQISEELGVKDLAVSIQEDLHDDWITFSRHAVELIFWETLENAVKFHPEQTPQIRINVSRHGQKEIGIQVEDNGITLSPDQLSKIWAPYYQGEKYSTGEANGMGLGLAMVAALVWEVGGTCRAYNRQNNSGLMVELFLPLAES